MEPYPQGGAGPFPKTDWIPAWIIAWCWDPMPLFSSCGAEKNPLRFVPIPRSSFPLAYLAGAVWCCSQRWGWDLLCLS